MLQDRPRSNGLDGSGISTPIAADRHGGRPPEHRHRNGPANCAGPFRVPDPLEGPTEPAYYISDHM